MDGMGGVPEREADSASAMSHEETIRRALAVLQTWTGKSPSVEAGESALDAQAEAIKAALDELSAGISAEYSGPVERAVEILRAALGEQS